MHFATLALVIYSLYHSCYAPVFLESLAGKCWCVWMDQKRVSVRQLFTVIIQVAVMQTGYRVMLLSEKLNLDKTFLVV